MIARAAATILREYDAGGCQHVIRISLAWSLLSLARSCSRKALSVRTTLRVVRRSPSFHQVKAQAAQLLAHSMTSACRRALMRPPASFLCTHSGSHTHSIAPTPPGSICSRNAPSTSSERHGRSKAVPIFSMTPMSSRAAAADNQLDQRQDLDMVTAVKLLHAQRRLGSRQWVRSR